MHHQVSLPPEASGSDPYVLETKRKALVWKAFLRSTGSLGERWLRRTARQDWTRNTLAPGVDLVTYWLDEQLGGGGTGTCIAVYCHGYEVLRFDCFGGTRGHFHITPFTPWTIFGCPERRLHFREQTIPEQIEHALFEIAENLDFYLHLNPRRSIRKVRVEPAARREACEAARRQLHAHLANVPALRALVDDEAGAVAQLP
jgi:hypothetical protein